MEYSSGSLAARLKAIHVQRALEYLEHTVGSRGGEEQVQAGALNDITIMRYAHVFRARASGGVEQYLRHLDRHLLERHRMTILQMHLVEGEVINEPEVEHIGLGRIFWIPVPMRRGDSARFPDLPRKFSFYFKTRRVQGCQLGMRSLGDLRRIGRLRHNGVVVSEGLADLLRIECIDLLALHWSTTDTGAVVDGALRAGVPYVFINHFENSRLSLRSTRKHIAHALRIGTVSALGIPEDLRSRCCNLSDGVDTEFFAPENAIPSESPKDNIVFLPGRIGEGKGHRDLLEAGRMLIAKNVKPIICFAGAVESRALLDEILHVNRLGALQNRVLLLGELNREELRSWYARSAVVALPTSSEGLGRVLLEAQAMRVPVVAYGCGGTMEALRPNISGFLLDKGDVAGLADRIEYLLKDLPVRVKMGESGREFVIRQFGIGALVQRHEAFYLEALCESAKGRFRKEGA